MSQKADLTLDLDSLTLGRDRLPVAVHGMASQPAMAPHDHLFHEIMVVEGGSAVHVTAGGRSRIGAGDVFVIRPQVWHGFEKPRRLRLTNLLIAPKQLRAYQDDLAAIDPAFELFRKRITQPWRRPPVRLRASGEQLRQLESLLSAIDREQRQRAPGWPVSMRNLALTVMVLTARLARGSEGQGSAPSTDRAVREAMDYLEEHAERTVSLEELAERCATSPFHLSRRFNEVVGAGINAYVHSIRAERACLLLRSTEMTITAVGLAMGYEDVSYFSRCFRRHVGVSPKRYRCSGGAG